MKRLRLNSGTRRPRRIHVQPELDQWVEGVATTWGVSYSEAANRLLAEFRKVRQELAAPVSMEPTDGTVAPLIHILLEQFKEQICRGLDNEREEIARVKSNLYLLQLMLDKAAIGLLGDQKYKHWQLQVKEAMGRRGNK